MAESATSLLKYEDPVMVSAPGKGRDQEDEEHRKR